MMKQKILLILFVTFLGALSFCFAEDDSDSLFEQMKEQQQDGQSDALDALNKVGIGDGIDINTLPATFLTIYYRLRQAWVVLSVASVLLGVITQFTYKKNKKRRRSLGAIFFIIIPGVLLAVVWLLPWLYAWGNV